ncbi:hypothetical protein JHV98_004605 [Salmonella enterica subsp. enterica serovar Senftenberg]|uniref:DNA polymerase V n=2 Tax=Salmonella enterica TaxID=28901 RepID=A0A5Z7PG60_SALER|nr:hypothetical protein [Salmonella enterica]EAA4514131.1 hypothetical protein [Salmonella enterica subsp. enterica serovar Vitkin]EAB5592048.1 hypothetical protein [Salmonella enterica subsp. enterica serovar Typhimurium]EAP5535785.1 hypothetical protein [Salmonella enterica subsp. enterica serovar Cerro]EBF6607738.1 hypothetical protein [Salmonella enterica subsp. enterica serovar Enteritidis]EBG3127655.1 hypothetical protein [Salmonella enterica subsp. enterica serovar Heidelberg]EBG561669
MGFPSPASDYVEPRLTVDILCGINANSRIVNTSDGYAVVDVSLIQRQGDTVLIRSDGALRFAKIMGQALIIDDGEAIEGEALDGVVVIGKVTYFINRINFWG